MEEVSIRVPLNTVKRHFWRASQVSQITAPVPEWLVSLGRLRPLPQEQKNPPKTKLQPLGRTLFSFPLRTWKNQRARPKHSTKKASLDIQDLKFSLEIRLCSRKRMVRSWKKTSYNNHFPPLRKLFPDWAASSHKLCSPRRESSPANKGPDSF